MQCGEGGSGLRPKPAEAPSWWHQWWYMHWYGGTLEQCTLKQQWYIGTVYNWYSCSVVQWYTGTLVHIGTLVHYWYRQWWHQGSTLRQGQQHVRRGGGLDSWFLVHIPPLGNILCRHEYQLITDCKRLRKKSSM